MLRCIMRYARGRPDDASELFNKTFFDVLPSFMRRIFLSIVCARDVIMLMNDYRASRGHTIQKKEKNTQLFAGFHDDHDDAVLCVRACK